MSLNIYVPCNCYKEGLCSEPPVDKNLIFYNENEYSLQLNLDYKGNENTYLKFDLWVEHCCIHENMDYFSDCIGTNMMIARFLGFIGYIDNKFKVIYNAMTSSYINYDTSKDLLKELNNLKIEMELENLTEKYELEEYRQYYDHFYEIIETLKKGCIASIETGNPLFFI